MGCIDAASLARCDMSAVPRFAPIVGPAAGLAIQSGCGAVAPPVAAARGPGKVAGKPGPAGGFEEVAPIGVGNRANTRSASESPGPEMDDNLLSPLGSTGADGPLTLAGTADGQGVAISGEGHGRGGEQRRRDRGGRRRPGRRQAGRRDRVGATTQAATRPISVRPVGRRREAPMATGTIRYLLTDRGVGFITPETLYPTLYFERRAVEGRPFERLSKGQRVRFEVAGPPRPAGCPRAEHVRPLAG
jgi:cold shock CspA family protein